MKPLHVLAVVLCLSVASAAQAPRQTGVVIANMQYEPATLDIKVGDSVVWTNSDDRDHTVTAADASFHSDNLPSGQSFRHRFTRAGKYNYHCKYHPRMKGTIIVSE